MKVENCSFDRIGGDAVDFSGSLATVYGPQGKSIGDKCISVGEGSRLTLSELECTEMMSGLAVKDGSICRVSQFYIDNSRYGIAVFTKKKTYSPASLSVEKVKFGNQTKTTYLLEAPHLLLMEKDTISATYSKGEIFKLLYKK